MISRFVLSALLAGLIAGAVLTALQVWKLSPLIVTAETYEHAPSHAGHVHEAGTTEWQPAPGLPRLGFTGAASLLAGAGFALLLAGISLVTNNPITKANGWVWGLCGFAAVHLAPSFSLAPVLPGMPEGDLAARQIWWLCTILATGAGLYLCATQKQLWAYAAAAALIILPHAIGAPPAVHEHSLLPPELAAEFTAKALGAAAIFWLVMGMALGQMLPSLNEKFES